MAYTNVQQIVDYLTTNGPMSGRDICSDCRVNELDVQLAEHAGKITSCAPVPGGVGCWFRAS